jgi:hypothetical protein
MSKRRNFLALVGGTMFSGNVQQRASAATPTLVLPPRLVAAAPARPLLDAMRARGESQMDVFISIGERMPKQAYLDWLEDGLQRSMLFDPPDEAAREREIDAAVKKHGSIVAAVRAGAIRSAW